MVTEEQETGQQSTAQPSGKAGQQPATAAEQTSQSAAARREPEQHGQGMQPHRTGQWLSPLDEMERAFERMFERVFPRGWMRPWRMESPFMEQIAPALEVRAPRLDMIDRENEIVLRAEIPGVKKEDLDVSIQDDLLTIRGEAKREAEEEEEGQYRWREMSYGTFSRSVPLPAGVDMDKCKVTFKDGILEVRLPKTEQAKRRKIQIEEAG